MGHFMDDGHGDEGGSGEGAGEEASAIQRPGLMVSAWSYHHLLYFTNARGPPPVKS